MRPLNITGEPGVGRGPGVEQGIGQGIAQGTQPGVGQGMGQDIQPGAGVGRQTSLLAVQYRQVVEPA